MAPCYGRAFAGESVRVTDQPLDTRGSGLSDDRFDALLLPLREADGQVAYVHMTGFEGPVQHRTGSPGEDQAACVSR